MIFPHPVASQPEEPIGSTEESIQVSPELRGLIYEALISKARSHQHMSKSAHRRGAKSQADVHLELSKQYFLASENFK